MLTELNKTKHNSNHKTQQTSLEGEIIQEYTYFALGFVPADEIRRKKEVWFIKLKSEPITSVEKFIESHNHSYW